MTHSSFFTVSLNKGRNLMDKGMHDKRTIIHLSVVSRHINLPYSVTLSLKQNGLLNKYKRILKWLQKLVLPRSLTTEQHSNDARKRLHDKYNNYGCNLHSKHVKRLTLLGDDNCRYVASLECSKYTTFS